MLDTTGSNNTAIGKKKRVPKYSLNHHREEIARNGFIVFEVVYNYNTLAEDLSLRNLVDQ
jgi:hypothetical protein